MVGVQGEEEGVHAGQASGEGEEVRLTDEQAQVVVATWLADGCFGEVAHALPEVGGTFRFKYRLRVLVACRNPLANDALWDGKPNLAKALLMRYGIGTRNLRPHHPANQGVKVRKKDEAGFYSSPKDIRGASK